MEHALTYFIKKMAGGFVEDLEMKTQLREGKLEVSVHNIKLKPRFFENLEREMQSKGGDIFSHGVEIISCTITSALACIPLKDIWTSRWEVSATGIEIEVCCLSDQRVMELRKKSRERAAAASFADLQSDTQARVARTLSIVSSLASFPPVAGQAVDLSLQEKLDKYFRSHLDLKFTNISGALYLKDDVNVPDETPGFDKRVWTCTVGEFVVNIGASMVEWPSWANRKINSVSRETRYPKKSATWAEDVSITLSDVGFGVLGNCFSMSFADEMFSLAVTKRSWDPDGVTVNSSGFQRIFVKMPHDFAVQVTYDAVGFQWGILEPLHELFEGVACSLPDFMDFFVAKPREPPCGKHVQRYLACLRGVHGKMQKLANLEQGSKVLNRCTTGGADAPVDTREVLRTVLDSMAPPPEFMKQQMSSEHVAEMYSWIISHDAMHDVNFKFVYPEAARIPYQWYLFPFYRYEVVMWTTCTMYVEVDGIQITIPPDMRVVMVRQLPGEWLIDTALNSVNVEIEPLLSLNLTGIKATLQWGFHPKSWIGIKASIQRIAAGVAFEFDLPSLEKMMGNILITQPWNWPQWGVFFSEWGEGPRPIPIDISVDISRLRVYTTAEVSPRAKSVMVKGITIATMKPIVLGTLEGAINTELKRIRIMDGPTEIAIVNKITVNIDSGVRNRKWDINVPLAIVLTVVKMQINLTAGTLLMQRKVMEELKRVRPLSKRMKRHFEESDLPKKVISFLRVAMEQKVHLQVAILAEETDFNSAGGVSGTGGRAQDVVGQLAGKKVCAQMLNWDDPAITITLVHSGRLLSLRVCIPQIDIVALQNAPRPDGMLPPSKISQHKRGLTVDIHSLFVDIKNQRFYEPFIEPFDIKCRFTESEQLPTKLAVSIELSDLDIVLCSSYFRFFMSIAQHINAILGPNLSKSKKEGIKEAALNCEMVNVLPLTNAATSMHPSSWIARDSETLAVIVIQRYFRGYLTRLKLSRPSEHSSALSRPLDRGRSSAWPVENFHTARQSSVFTRGKSQKLTVGWANLSTFSNMLSSYKVRKPIKPWSKKQQKKDSVLSLKIKPEGAKGQFGTLVKYASMPLPLHSLLRINFNPAKLGFASHQMLCEKSKDQKRIQSSSAPGCVDEDIPLYALQPDTMQQALRAKAHDDRKRVKTPFSFFRRDNAQKRTEAALQKIKEKNIPVGNDSTAQSEALQSLNLQQNPPQVMDKFVHPLLATTKRTAYRAMLGEHLEAEEIPGVLSTPDRNTNAHSAVPIAYYCHWGESACGKQVVVIRSPLLIMNGSDRVLDFNLDFPQTPIRLLGGELLINPLFLGDNEANRKKFARQKGEPVSTLPSSLPRKWSLLPGHAGSILTKDRDECGNADLLLRSEFVDSTISITGNGTVRLSRDEVLETEVVFSELNVSGRPRRIVTVGLRAPLSFLNQCPVPIRVRYGAAESVLFKTWVSTVIDPGCVFHQYNALVDKFVVNCQHAAGPADAWCPNVVIKRHKPDWRELRSKVSMEKGKAKVELLFRFKKNVCVIGTPAVIQTKQMKFTLQLTDRSGKPCYAPNPKTYLVHSNSTYLAHMLPPLSMKPANSPARWRKTREFIARKAANVLRENAPLSSAISGFSTSDNDERLYRPGLSDYDDEVDSCGAKALERYQGAKKDSVNSTKSTKRQKYGVKLPNLFYSTVGWAKVTLMLAPTEDNDASKCGDIFPLICTYTHIPNYFGSQASISGCIITVQPRYFIVNRTKYLLEFRLVDPKVTQHAVVARPLPSTPLAPWTTEPIWLKSWMKRPSIEVSTRGGFWSSAIVLSPSKTGRYSMVFGAMVLTVELIEHDGVMHVFIRRKICFSFSIDSSARMLRRAGLLTDSREQRVFWAMGPEEEGQRSTQKVTKGGDILENKEKQRGVAIGFFDPFRASEERLNTVEIILPSIKGIFQEYIDSFQSPISTATLPPTEGDYFPPVSGEKEHTDMTSDDSCSNADNPSEAVRFTIRTDVGTLFILVGPGLLAIDPSKCLCVVIRRLYGCTHILFATKHLDGIAPLASEHALDKASGDNWYICATCGSTLKSHQIPFCPECRSPLVWPLMYHEERDADSSNALTVGDHHALVRHEGISVMARMQEWWEFYMGAALSVQIKLNGADISLIDRPARREILHALIGAVTGTFDAPHGAGVISRTVCVTVDWLQVAARFSSVEARKKAGTSCTNRAIVYTRDNEDKPASSGAIDAQTCVCAPLPPQRVYM
eukprot:GEMP01000371.1.p1 GENE.GEMP01000371.1~~GEMP01000371.1.p1  ORF type:complete len:2226 (+),score=444.71 GEMP01000371.1:365-7042(+)